MVLSNARQRDAPPTPARRGKAGPSVEPVSSTAGGQRVKRGRAPALMTAWKPRRLVSKRLLLSPHQPGAGRLGDDADSGWHTARFPRDPACNNPLRPAGSLTVASGDLEPRGPGAMSHQPPGTGNNEGKHRGGAPRAVNQVSFLFHPLPARRLALSTK